MDIELLVVAECPHAVPAHQLITTAVADARVQANITRTVITSEQHAKERGFTGSPTILLNGADPFAQPDARVALSCRLYPTPRGFSGVPALRDLRQAINRVAAGQVV